VGEGNDDRMMHLVKTDRQVQVYKTRQTGMIRGRLAIRVSAYIRYGRVFPNTRMIAAIPQRNFGFSNLRTSPYIHTTFALSNAV